MATTRHRPSDKGFTLIEIAVGLIILGILLTMGLGVINAQLTSANYATTKKRQEAVKDVLTAYFGANKRLPCPFVPTPGTPVTGIENCPSPLNSANPAGVIPFVTLGLAKEAVEDGWGNLFTYRVFADSAATTCPVTGGQRNDWRDTLCYGAGKVGALIVNEGTVATPAPITASNNQFVAVVISHGGNGLGAWVATQGTQNAAPITCDEAHNAGTAPPAGCAIAANTFYKGERADQNDDVVAALTGNDLMIALAKQGTLKSKEAQVNDDLQVLFDQAFSVRVNSCTGTILTPTALDPWGNAYVVHNLNSTTFQVCFYSTAGGTGTETGVGATGTGGTCIFNAPAIGRSLDKSSVDTARQKAGSAACP